MPIFNHGINQRLQTAFNDSISSRSETPGQVDTEEAIKLIDLAKDINESSTSCCGFKKNSTRGDKDLAKLLRQSQTQFSKEAKSVIAYYLERGQLPPVSVLSPSQPEVPVDPIVPYPPVESVKGVLIGQWKCEKPTWHCHWWPQQERSRVGGDPANNLFYDGPGGALWSYDKIFGTNSMGYEKKYHSHPFVPRGTVVKPEEDKSWWGSCNYASQVASLLKKPKKSVFRNGIELTPHAVGGLLVKVIPSLVTTTDFRGDRYNGPSDDPNDPNPYVFLNDVLRPWCINDEKRVPIILDIDNETSVWNYPYDQGEVYESLKAPEVFGFDVSKIPPEGKTYFYKAEMKGMDFQDQERNYRFWIQYKDDSKKEVLASGWIIGREKDGKEVHKNPDFAWRSQAKGDLSKREAWVTNVRAQNNPYIRAEDVYDIYMESIGEPVSSPRLETVRVVSATALPSEYLNVTV